MTKPMARAAFCCGRADDGSGHAVRDAIWRFRLAGVPKFPSDGDWTA